MKTFSAMSIPDKNLTLQAYIRLQVHYSLIGEDATRFPEEERIYYKGYSLRLLDLIEVLTQELNDEEVSGARNG